MIVFVIVVANVSTVSQHDKSVHEGVCYTCEQCNFKTKTKYNLKQHLKSIHDGVYFKCEQCDLKA